MEVPTIRPTELHQKHLHGEKIELLDVRTPLEFQGEHAAIARNQPLESLQPSSIVARRNGSSGEPLYVICRTGSRGAKACEKLMAAGLQQVVNVEGGTAAWDAAGLPVVRGRKVMSLERQVRIAAGALIVVGAVLGFFVHPYWIGLAAFVGAGLIFAGVTDSCAMGMLIAKMPWNQVGGGQSCSA